MNFSVDSKVKEIYEDERARAVLEAALPKLTRTPSFQMTFGMSLRTLCSFSQWKLTAEQMEQLDRDLQAIE